MQEGGKAAASPPKSRRGLGDAMLLAAAFARMTAV